MGNGVGRRGEVVYGQVGTHEFDPVAGSGGGGADLDGHEVHIDDADRPPGTGEPGRGTASAPAQQPVGIAGRHDRDPDAIIQPQA